MRHIILLLFGISYSLLLSAIERTPPTVNLDSRYRVCTNDLPLGRGNFATVLKGACLQSGEHIAVKIIRLDGSDGADSDSNIVTIDDKAVTTAVSKVIAKKASPGSRHGALAEIQTLHLLKDPNIVKLLAAIRCQNIMFLVMDYAKGSTLAQIIFKGAVTEDWAKPIFSQICSAVSYCHKNLVAHRDLKPHNFIVDDENMRIKVIDFGLSVIGIKAGKRCKAFTGTPIYCALEVLVRRAYDPYLADVWSLGITLYEMLTQEVPWDARNYDDFVASVAADPLDLPDELSAQAKSLIINMLSKVPKSRFDIEEVMNDGWCHNA